MTVRISLSAFLCVTHSFASMTSITCIYTIQHTHIHQSTLYPTQKPNFLILDEPSNDIDINTLNALETYLQEFNGVLLIVSHDRFFTDKVTDHLFIFEGDGVVKDYIGSLSEYAECLIEQEKSNSYDMGKAADKTSSNGQGTAKATTAPIETEEERKARNARRNKARNAKKEMNALEKKMEKLKDKAAKVQKELDSTNQDEGWTVLADLTDQVNAINEEVEEKELLWLELAEIVEEAEVDGIL